MAPGAQSSISPETVHAAAVEYDTGGVHVELPGWGVQAFTVGGSTPGVQVSAAPFSVQPAGTWLALRVTGWHVVLPSAFGAHAGVVAATGTGDRPVGIGTSTETCVAVEGPLFDTTTWYGI
jgi:hypothetical protein